MKKLTRELSRVINAEDEYTKIKIDIVKSLKQITWMVEEFDNPLYRSKFNDGGEGHVGSIDW